MVKKGTFRSDLYYRLNVFPIKVPPLRERKDDIPLLVRHFIDKFGGKEIEIENNALRKLEGYNWPGNVRQMINVVQRALINRGEGKIRAEQVTFDEGEEDLFHGTMAEIEKAVLLKRIEEHGGNKTMAAKSLGVSRKWIYLKLNEIEEGSGRGD